MTKPKVVFSPVSQEYFENPYEMYQRMRDDAPAVLRRGRGLLRADPARGRGGGVQGPRVVLVGPRLRPRRWCAPARCRRSRSSSWTRPTTGTCAACSTRRSHPGPSSRSSETVVELVEHYLGKADPGQLRRRAGLLRPVPGRGHHPDGRRARGVPPAGPALDRHQPAPQAGSDRAGRRQHAGQHRLGHVLLRAGPGAAGEPRRTT